MLVAAFSLFSLLILWSLGLTGYSFSLPVLSYAFDSIKSRPPFPQVTPGNAAFPLLFLPAKNLFFPVSLELTSLLLCVVKKPPSLSTIVVARYRLDLGGFLYSVDYLFACCGGPYVLYAGIPFFIHFKLLFPSV